MLRQKEVLGPGPVVMAASLLMVAATGMGMGMGMGVGMGMGIRLVTGIEIHSIAVGSLSHSTMAAAGPVHTAGLPSRVYMPSHRRPLGTMEACSSEPSGEQTRSLWQAWGRKPTLQ